MSVPISPLPIRPMRIGRPDAARFSRSAARPLGGMLCMGIAPGIQREDARRVIGRRAAGARPLRHRIALLYFTIALCSREGQGRVLPKARFGLGIYPYAKGTDDEPTPMYGGLSGPGGIHRTTNEHRTSVPAQCGGKTKRGRTARQCAVQRGPASLRTSFAVYSSVMRTVGLTISNAPASACTLLAPPAAITRTGTFLMISSGTDITRSLIG